MTIRKFFAVFEMKILLQKKWYYFYIFTKIISIFTKIIDKTNCSKKKFRNNIRKYNFVFTFTFYNFCTNIQINNRINRDSIFFQIYDELYYL